ncbi:MAG: hypothetical protein E7172_00340 [Firmicutes bacterium]|nr:hypothetical protein [Bacillota bacterium]
MAFIYPITTNTKNFPTYYELQNTKKVKYFVLCEHIRSIDFNSHKLSFVEKIKEELEEFIDIKKWHCRNIEFQKKLFQMLMNVTIV